MSKMNKLLRLLVKLLSVVTLFVFSASCNDKKDKTDEKGSLRVDTNELTFTQKDESQDFNILVKGEWYVEAEGLQIYYGANAGDIRDFTITPINGIGDAKIAVTLNEVSENYEVKLTIVEKDKENKEMVTLKVAAS
jgi:hypothetical protein